MDQTAIADKALGAAWDRVVAAERIKAELDRVGDAIEPDAAETAAMEFASAPPSARVRRIVKHRAVATLTLFLPLSGCGYALPSEADFIKLCTASAMKVQTRNCSGALDCTYPSSTEIPIDLGASPPVARMRVGSTGWVFAESIGNNNPANCLAPGMIGGIRFDVNGVIHWETTDPNVLQLLPREAFASSTFVKAVAPGEAQVLVTVRGVEGRTGLSHCPGYVESCVTVGKIVVTP